MNFHKPCLALNHDSIACFRDDTERLFSQSRRARQIMAQEGLPLGVGRAVVLPDISPTSSPSTPTVSDPSHPTPPQEDRRMIVTNTRNINALAAKKRSKVQHDLLNLERQQGGERSFYPNSPDGDTLDDSYLSTAMLANHNRRLGELPYLMNVRQPSMESTATFSMRTEASLPPLRGRQSERYRAGRRRDRDAKRGKRSKYNDKLLFSSQVSLTLSSIVSYIVPVSPISTQHYFYQVFILQYFVGNYYCIVLLTSVKIRRIRECRN